MKREGILTVMDYGWRDALLFADKAETACRETGESV